MGVAGEICNVTDTDACREGSCVCDESLGEQLIPLISDELLISSTNESLLSI